MNINTADKANCPCIIFFNVEPFRSCMLRFIHTNKEKWWVKKKEKKGGSYLMRADLAASSWWGASHGAGRGGWVEEEDGGRVEEDVALWLGFFLFRTTCRDLTLVGWTGPWLLRRRAALRTGTVSALWKAASALETEVKLSEVSVTGYWLKWVTRSMWRGGGGDHFNNAVWLRIRLFDIRLCKLRVLKVQCVKFEWFRTFILVKA